MEIPVIARMSDFDAGIVSFAAAGASPITSLVGLSTFKWGALILAVIYAFGRIARRIEIFVLQRNRRSKSKLSQLDSWSTKSDDEDDVVSSDESNEDEDEEDSENEVREENLGGFFEDFRVAGRKRKFSIRRRRTFSGENSGEFGDGNGVVKLWDGLGLNVDFGCSEGSIPVMDLDRNLVVGSIIGRSPVVSPSSPRVVVAAGEGGGGKVGVRSWDMRLRRRTPAVAAEWRFDGRPEVAAAGERVYVRDGVSGSVTVGDMRKANSPLVEVTEYDGGGWFDADVVSESEEE